MKFGSMHFYLLTHFNGPDHTCFIVQNLMETSFLPQG